MELLVMVLSETTIPAEFLPPKVPSGVRSGTFAGHPAMPRKDDASACSAKPLGPEPLVSKGLQLQLHFWDRNRQNRRIDSSLLAINGVPKAPVHRQEHVQRCYFGGPQVVNVANVGLSHSLLDF